MIAGLLAAFFLGEAAVRLAGHEPWQSYGDMAGDAFVRMRASDDRLGWRNLPGEYRSERNTVTILSDGSRRATELAAADAPEVWLVGGSFIYGQGLSDEQTLASQLAAPEYGWRAHNFGVSGFGTYQSLLLLEDLLDRRPPPQIVVYGLIDHHIVRNIGRGMWQRALAQLAVSEYPKLPYCSVDAGGRLVRYQAEAYPQTPLREYSALIELGERTYAEWKSQDREAQRELTTELLLAEMHELCSRRGVSFLVALLEDGEAGSPSWAIEAAERQQVPLADCRVPLTPERRVPVDSHPNETVQRMWAECLSEPLARLR